MSRFVGVPPSRAVLVEWLDSGESAGWSWLDEHGPHVPVPVLSLGWVLQDDGAVLAVSSHVSRPNEEGRIQVCGIMHIPKGVILRVTNLPAPVDDA